MGPRRSTRANQQTAIQGIRAYRAQHDPGRRNQGIQGRSIRAIRQQTRNLVTTDRLNNRLEFARIATGNGPSQLIRLVAISLV